ncbi:MAG TPA: GMC family oxidoreductase [Amaricoccus sp.]|uniref:GMC family oxidoreductase n=2 Tax=Amaricoccus TaxID=56999 RepID=UPI002BC93192|nr:GMC family oxidoreductase [Amaricoccus sp.]HRO12996.1 GMC family oxidoreductase [Amaricoccus sp.]
MIFDVETNERSAFARPFDVCVIGSGPAGITLARRLAGRGLDVALMEGGGLEWSEESQAVYAGESVGLSSPDLDIARVRCLGGSSGHWNGLCRAFEAADMRPRPQNPLSGWPITRADLDPYQAEVAEILDLVPASDDVPPANPDPPQDGFRQVWYWRSAPTRFGEKYLDEFKRTERIALGVQANLVDLRLDDDLTRVTGAVFRGYAADDPGFTVRARHYCLCTGGYENPRLLLNFTSQIPAGIGNQNDLVGRYFCDHLRMQVGEVLFSATPEAEVRYFTPTEEFLAEHRTLNIVLHLDHYRRKALSLPEELMRSTQCAVPFVERLVEAMTGDALQCDRGGLEDWLASRDSVANPWGRVVVNSEQALNPESRVTLAETRDAFGLQRIRLNWQTREIDTRTLQDTTLAFAAHLAERNVGRARLYDSILGAQPLLAAVADGQQVSGWHHMCTTRMSDDPKTGVVDRNCRVHGIANLHVGGSSVFSTPGFQNPTYTIVQLALRLGDHLAETLPAGEAPVPGDGQD